MSLIKQLAGETIIYGIGHILPRVFHYLVFSTYLTYRLTEARAEYAIYLDLYAYASILIVLFSYRMDTALFRFGSKSDQLSQVYRTAFIPMIGTSVILIVSGILFSEEIARGLTYPGKGHYVIWFSFIIALDVLALLPMAKLRLLSRAKTFVAFKLANVLITVALVFLFLEAIPRMDPYILADYFPFADNAIDFVFLSNLIASAVMFLGLIWYQPVRRFEVNWGLWIKMVKYAWPLIIVGIAGGINQFFGVPLQKYFLGQDFDLNKDQAGIYGAVQKIPALLAIFTTAYNYAAEPFFFRNAQREDARQLYGDIALFFIIVAGIMMLGISLFIDLFQFVIGPSFREGLYLVPILLMSYLFLGIYYNISIWYKLSDHTMYGAIIASIGAFITLWVSITLLPSEGIIASAYAALLCYMTMVILAYFIGRIKYPINYPVISMLRQIAMIVALMYLGLMFRSTSTLQNLSMGLLIIAVYCILTYIMEQKRIRTYL